MTSVYFAHPVDFAGSEVQQKVKLIRNALVESLGCTVFDPGAAFSVPTGRFNSTPPHAAYLQRLNFEALESADLVLAYVPDPAGSFGVPFELGYAVAQGRPLVVLVEDGWERSVVLRWLADQVHVLPMDSERELARVFEEALS